MRSNKSRLKRNLLNSPTPYCYIYNTIVTGVSCIPLSTKHNAVYGSSNLHKIVMNAVVLNRNAAGRVSSIRGPVQVTNTKLRQPTAEWLRLPVSKTKYEETVQCAKDMTPCTNP